MNYFKIFIFALLSLSFGLVYSYHKQEVPVIECHTEYDVQVKGFPIVSEANKISTYVYNTYGKNYMLLFMAENGAFTKERKHNLSYNKCVSHYDDIQMKWIPARMDKYYNKSGVREGKYYCHGHREEFNDWGLCGTSDYYHPDITNDKRFLTDWKRQADQCVKMKQEGTIFYGRQHRLKYENRFIIKEKSVCEIMKTLNE